MMEFKLQAISFGSMFLFLVALRLFFVKTSDPRKYFEIIIAMSASLVFTYPVLNERGIFFGIALLNHLYLPVYFVFGPSIYLLTLCFLGKFEGMTRNRYLLFAPAVLVLAVELAAYAIHPALFDHRPIDIFSAETLHPLDYAEFIGFAFNGAFFGYTALVFLKSVTLESIRREKSIRLVLFEITCVSIGMGITAGGYVFRNKDLAVYGILSLLLLAIIAYIFTEYHESAYDEIGRVVERYQKSRLEGVDIGRLERDIERRMNAEKLFTEDSLTLAGLAERLGIRPYQLSEYLNSNRQMNFSRFINEYRIAEACRLLLEDSEANIIHIAYAVGYNSKANFNLAFKTITGMTPSDFLKKKGKKS
ncbi:MAG: AraC family transcriptional regulator [Spirochaetes bacterium]|nr:AraC family transcriptional regulator [Spirochaetota bacterium]